MSKGVYDRMLASGFVRAGTIGWLLEDLRQRYGSYRLAGRAYDERYGLCPGSGYRQLCRILYPASGVQAITWNTFDRLRTLAAS